MATAWPDDWEERKRGKDCPMCASTGLEETEHGIRIKSGRYSDAYLQRRGPVRGYVIVSWRGRHVAEPMELSWDEASGYWREILDVAHALETKFMPLKINLEILGNSVPHLHTHVTPRYRDDGSPMRPLKHGGSPAHPEDELWSDVAALRELLA